MLNNPTGQLSSTKRPRGRPRRDKNLCALVGCVAREISKVSEKTNTELEVLFQMGEAEKLPTGEMVHRGYKGREWRRYKAGKTGMFPNRFMKIVRTALAKSWLGHEWAQVFFPQSENWLFDYLPSFDLDLGRESIQSPLENPNGTHNAGIKASHDFFRMLTKPQKPETPSVDLAWLKFFWDQRVELKSERDYFIPADQMREIEKAIDDFWVDNKLIRRQVRWAANKLHFAAYGSFQERRDDLGEAAHVALLHILKISAGAFTHDESFTANFLDSEGGVNLDRLLRWLATDKISIETSFN